MGILRHHPNHKPTTDTMKTTNISYKTATRLWLKVDTIARRTTNLADWRRIEKIRGRLARVLIY